MGSTPRTPPARLATLVAVLIALCAAPAYGAGEAAFSQPRSLAAVNGFAAAPAIGPDGRAVVAVSDYSADRSRVLAYTRSARGRWDDAATVLRTSRQELLEPRAAFTGDGAAVFTWIRAPRIDQEQVVESRRLTDSGVLRPVATLSPVGDRAVFARVAGGPGGRALVGWETGDYGLRAAEGDAGGFGPADVVFQRRNFGFSLAYLTDGTAVALNQSFGPGGVQVRLKPPGGAWGDPITLSGPRTAREAVMATGPDGTLAIAWAQYTGDDGYRVQYAVRPLGGSFSRVRTVHPGDDGEARAPGLAVQPDGSVVLAWLSGAKLSWLVRAGEVRVAVVADGGRLSAASRVSGAGRRLSTAPHVFVDDEGDALIAWEENRRLMAATRTASGRLTAARAVSAAGARIFSSRVVANARGQALAAWTVDRGRTNDGALIQAAEITF